MRPTLNVKVPLPSTVLLFFVLLMVLAVPSVGKLRGILFIVLGVYLLFMMFVNREPIRWLHALWIGCFYLLSVMSMKWSIYPEGADQVLSNLGYALILNWSLGEYVFQGKRSINHMSAIMAAISLLLIVNFIANSTILNGRYSLNTNANVVGMSAAYLYGIMLYGAKEAKWKKVHLNILSVVVAVMTLLTGSRKALVMLLLFSVGYTFFWIPEKNLGKFIGRIIAVVCVGVVIVFLLMKVELLYNTIGRRIESLYMQWIEGEDVDASAITRSRMIEIGMRMFKYEPLLGFGHNGFKYCSGYWTYSHNNYVELLVSLGVSGFALFYLPLFYFTIEAFILWFRGVKGAIFPLTIFILQYINDVGQVSYYSYHVQIFVGIAVGYVYLFKRQYKQERNRLRAQEEVRKSQERIKQAQQRLKELGITKSDYANPAQDLAKVKKYFMEKEREHKNNEDK